MSNGTRALAMAACLAVVVSTAGSSHGAGARPGLPATPGAWGQVVQGGAAQAAKAKQWVRVPMQLTAISNDSKSSGVEFVAQNYIFLLSEAGEAPAYGASAPFTVNTVAFGSIPVVATLRIAQRRDSNDLPIPMLVRTTDRYIQGPGPHAGYPAGWAGGRDFDDTVVEEVLTVEVVTLVIDGVDVGIHAGCRAPDAALHLFGKGYLQRYAGSPDDEDVPPDPTRTWRTGHFAAGSGGVLTGSIDVPAFEGCVTGTGDDVSPLLTATVAGSGNQAVLHLGDPLLQCTDQFPPLPGDYDAASLCPDKLPFPVELPPLAYPIPAPTP